MYRQNDAQQDLDVLIKNVTYKTGNMTQLSDSSLHNLGQLTHKQVQVNRTNSYMSSKLKRVPPTSKKTPI